MLGEISSLAVENQITPHKTLLSFMSDERFLPMTGLPFQK